MLPFILWAIALVSILTFGWLCYQYGKDEGWVDGYDDGQADAIEGYHYRRGYDFRF